MRKQARSARGQAFNGLPCSMCARERCAQRKSRPSSAGRTREIVERKCSIPKGSELAVGNGRITAIGHEPRQHHEARILTEHVHGAVTENESARPGVETVIVSR